MTDRAPACGKCSTAMELGFVLDYTHGAMTQSSWVEGEPERSFWTGVKIKGHQKLPVNTYRCPNCGFLESYAPSADGE